MATRKPLTLNAGQIEQLPDSDTLVLGGFSIASPSAGSLVLVATAAGITAWEAKPFGYSLAAPAADDQVLVSTAAGAAGWVTAGNNQLLASNGTGEVAWEAKTFGYNLAAPTADDQVLVSTAAGAAGWVTAAANQVLASDGAGEVAWANKPFGYNLASPTTQNLVLAATGAGAAAWTDSLTLSSLTATIINGPVPQVLTANRTIYVRTTGDDTTGDGSLGNPYATVRKAVEVVGNLYTGPYTVTVDIGEGTWSHTTPLAPFHPFGAFITYTGVVESHAGCACSGYTGLTSIYTALQYFDFNVTLPAGAAAAVGQFVLVTSATGGTNPELIRGVHEIVAWNAGTRTATLRVIRRSGIANMPSGAITANITVVKTVLSFTSDGIKINGTGCAGTWRQLCVKGNHDHYGFWALNGGSIILGSCCCSSNWGTNLASQNLGLIYADGTYHANADDYNAFALSSEISLRFGAVVSGARSIGVYANSLGVVLLSSDSLVIASGGSYAIYSSRGSIVEIRGTTTMVSGGGTATALYADNGAGIDAYQCTVKGYTTTRSPATNPGNEEAWIIHP